VLGVISRAIPFVNRRGTTRRSDESRAGEVAEGSSRGPRENAQLAVTSWASSAVLRPKEFVGWDYVCRLYLLICGGGAGAPTKRFSPVVNRLPLP